MHVEQTRVIGQIRMPSIPVIDLFAGPGGLAEGFASLRDRKGIPCFDIRLSIEKEASAHRTLELRAFARSFNGNLPKEYYDYLKGKIDRESLFSNDKFKGLQEIEWVETGCFRARAACT